MLAFSIRLLAQNEVLNYVESSTGLAFPSWEGGMTELEFTDINDDGKIDIISVGDHGSPNINATEHGIMVWFGDGQGNWAVQMYGDLGYGGVAVGDVNNDGIMDVGYGIHHNYSSTDLGDQILEVALGDGTGLNWVAWDDGLATNGEDWGMFGSDFADIDHDGDLDLGSISFGCCAGVHVYRNNQNGSWTQTFGFLGGNSGERLVFGDINKDGYPDMAIAHQNGVVYFGDGNGNFSNATGNLPSPGTLGYSGPSLGDVDEDGSKDLAFCRNGGVQVWKWDISQNLWISISGTLPTSGNFEETQVWDMNVDGHLDVCAYGTGTFKLWLGDGQGNWTPDAQFIATGIEECKAFRVGGDVDHNGYPDIIMVGEWGNWINYKNYLKCYKETSVATEFKIHGLFPRGNEVFYQQSVQFIDWITAVPGGDSSNVSIYLSVTGIGGPYEEVITGVPDNGRYQWNVPMAYSDNCYLRFVAQKSGIPDAADTTGPFTITGTAFPTAMFVGEPLFGVAPLTVSFTDLSAGNVISWEWDFQNDGIDDSSEENPVFTYTDPGLYAVKLKVSDGSTSDSLIRSEYIDVIPTGFDLSGSYRNNVIRVVPNPVHGQAAIYLDLQEEKPVSCILYCLKGSFVQELGELIRNPQYPNRYVVPLSSSGLTKGVYMICLKTNINNYQKKIIIL